MPATIDDLLRAADKGQPIGTTQRYFKPGVTPTPPAPSASAPSPTPAAPAETEKEMIDRILGRKRQSMSDAPGELAAGQQYAQAEPGVAPERGAPGKTFTYTLKRGDQKATVESPRELTPDELTTLAGKTFGAPAQPEPQRRYLGGGQYLDEHGVAKQLEPGELEKFFPEEAKATRRSGGILAGTEKPQSMDEVALQAVGAVPMMVGPWWAQAGLTGARAALRGDDALHGAVDVAGNLVGLGALKAAGKAASKIAGPAEALEWIRERIGKGADASVNHELLDGLLAWWNRQPTAAAKDAVGERVVQNLRDNFGKEVAQMFRRQILRGAAHAPGVPAVRAGVPLGVAEKARGAVQATESDLGRAGVSSLTGTPPFSAMAVQALEGAAKPALRHLPGGREVGEVIEEAAAE